MSRSTAFDRSEFDLAYPDGVEDYYWTIARNHLILDTIRRTKLQNARWLEIGCGRGIVLRHLIRNGLNCRGVELADVEPLDEVVAVVAVKQDAIAMPAEFRRSFDGLLLLDVIEHLEHPVEFLNSILTHFPNLQNVLLTVPARAEIWSNYDTFYGHYRRYDAAMLEETVRGVGFTSRESRYFFHSLYPAAKIIVQLQRRRRVKISAPTGGMKLVHRLLASYFIAEMRLLPKRWLGTSLLCLASKSV